MTTSTTDHEAHIPVRRLLVQPDLRITSAVDRHTTHTCSQPLTIQCQIKSGPWVSLTPTRRCADSVIVSTCTFEQSRRRLRTTPHIKCACSCGGCGQGTGSPSLSAERHDSFREGQSGGMPPSAHSAGWQVGGLREQRVPSARRHLADHVRLDLLILFLPPSAIYGARSAPILAGS